MSRILCAGPWNRTLIYSSCKPDLRQNFSVTGGGSVLESTGTPERRQPRELNWYKYRIFGQPKREVQHSNLLLICISRGAPDVRQIMQGQRHRADYSGAKGALDASAEGHEVIRKAQPSLFSQGMGFLSGLCSPRPESPLGRGIPLAQRR